MGFAVSGPYLAVNGRRATMVNLLFPLYGAPICDVTVADATPLPTDAPFVVSVANLNVKMSVATTASGTKAQRPFAGSLMARLVGGAGTWQTPVTVGPYSNPSGVLMSTILRDVTMATGTTASLRESVKLSEDRSVGPFFVPGAATPAARILSLLAGRLWWIDVNGTTQIAPTRPTTQVKGPATVSAYPGDTRILSVATENWAEWLPGAQYSGATVPERVTVLATRIHSGADGTARLEAMVS